MSETETKTVRTYKRRMGETTHGSSERKRPVPASSRVWPPIKPKPYLQITRLKDTDLFTVQSFFTSAESTAFIKAAESIGFFHQGSLGPAKGEAYRDNDRISVNDASLAATVWESGLEKLFSGIKVRGKVAIGLNPNIRFYRVFRNKYATKEHLREFCSVAALMDSCNSQHSSTKYKVGQHFGKHIDESVDLGEGKRTHYTLLIYLSGGGSGSSRSGPKSKTKNEAAKSNNSASNSLIGGETVFYGSRNSIVAEVVPTEGMALLHLHGDKCMLHEARNVTRGLKYVFRSDVVFA